MKFAPISPTNYLKDFCLFGGNKYHMLLVQRVLTDDEYVYFYNNLDSTHFKILDNGACELGESIKYKDLIKAVAKIHPDVLVLPDSLKESRKTIELSSKFIEEYWGRLKKQGVELMGVVQGSTRDEWLECLKIFNSDVRIKFIGISDTKAVFTNSKFPRVRTIQYIVENGLISSSKKIHLLGLGNSGHIELQHLRKYPQIEGCDSGAPIVHGVHMIDFVKEKEYKKINQYLDPNCTLTNKQYRLAIKNIKLLNYIVNG